jgi:hypothetical protein
LPRLDRMNLRRAILAGAAGLLATLSCGREVTGPQSLLLMRGFTFDARFDTPGLADGVAGEIVQFDRVRVVLVNTLGDTVVDRVVAFPSTAEEVALDLDVPLTSGAPTTGETMALSLRYINAQNDTVFRGGPLGVPVVPSAPGQQPPPAPVVPVTYTGVGAAAVSVVVTPQLDTVLAGDAFAFTAVALDGQGQPIANTPIAWRSESPARATITAPGAGAGTSLASRGPAMIIAQLLTGPADTVTLELLPRAQTLTIVSGNNQSATFNTALAQPLVTRVVATDGQPMAGVTVAFAVTSGGGTVSAPSAVTDVNGLAQVTWTTGSGLGAQQVTATVAGLAGGTVNFTAVAPATELLHHYPMTGGLVDVVGGVDGTLVGGATITDGVLALDGTTGYGQFGTWLVPGTGSYSVSFFVRDAGPATRYTSYVSQGQSNGPGFYIGYADDGQLRGPDGFGAVGIPAPVGDGLFHHHVLVADAVANQTRFYVDGALRRTLGTAITTAQDGTPTRFGRQFDPWSEFVNGAMDEVRIYRGALDAAAVATLMAAGPTTIDRMVFGTQPSNVAAGAAITPAVVVRVEDAQGRTRTTFNGAVSVALLDGGTATLGGLTTVNAVNGVATFADLSVDVVGTGYRLEATASAAPPVTSTPFTVSAGAASALTFTQSPTDALVGAAITPPIVVTAFDGSGNVATGFAGAVTLSFRDNPDAAVLGGTLTVNAVAGVATFSTVTVDRASTGMTLNATATGVAGAASAVFAISAGTATQLAVTQQPVTATAGATLTPSVVVTARDAGGNVATGFTDAVTIAIATGTGSVTGTLTVNAVAGVATFADLALTATNAALTLEATATGLASVTTAAIAVSPAAPAVLVFGQQPSTALSGQPLTPPVTVQARDAFGNLTPGFVGAVTVAIANNPGSATLGGTLTANAVAGVATFADLTVSTAGVGYTLSAASAGLTTATSSAFSISASIVANSWINAAGGTWSTAANWSLGRTPISLDTVVIAVPGDYTVTMDVNDTVAFMILGGGTGTQTLAIGARTLRVDSLLSVATTGAVTITGAAGNLTGPGVVSNQGTISTNDGTISVELVNLGALTLRSTSTISGALTNGPGGTMTALASNVGGTGSLTVTNGFTNAGLIELTTADAGYGNTVTVTNGTLVNAPTGVIRSTAGQGGRTLNAQLDNQGLIDLQNALTIARPSSAHVNSGTISVALGTLTVTQSGTAPSFTNTGTITIAPARTMAVSGGTLTLTGGTLDGPAGTLSTSGATVNLDVASARTRLTLTTTTVPGTVTIPALDSLRLAGGSPTMTIVNDGRLVLQDVMTFNGSVATGDTTSVIEIRSAAAYGQGNITFTNGFTNTGRIELRTLDASYGNRLAVTNGPLVNAPGGIIRAIPGFGSKELAAQLDNQGLLDVREALVLNRASSAHVNTGTIALATANLTVTQTGTAPSFTNTGTILAPSGRTFSLSGGTLNLIGGTFLGDTATLATSNATVNMDIASARTRFTLTTTTVPGTFTIPAGDSLRLVGGSPNMTIANSGRLVLQDAMTFPGTVTTGDTTSVIEIRSASSYGQANVTFTNGFINTGLIELRTLNAFYGNRFAVTTGPLVNAPGGIIRAIPGFGSKELAAQLDNQGLLDVREALVLNRASSAHSNTGVIDLATANLSVSQTGTTPSFTNTGTILAPSGRSLSVTGGTLNLTGGTFQGDTATLVTSGTTVNMDIVSARTRFNLTNSTVPGTFVIPAGDSLRLVGGSPNMTITNNGRLVLQDAMTFPGTVTTGDTTSVIEIRSSAAYGQGNVTFTNGFINTGLIELRTLNAFYGNRFAVTTGPLVNAPGAIIRAIPGFGSKELAAQLDNQGLLDVREALVLNRASSVHSNTGVIDLATANLTVTQGGTTPSFTNTGTILAPSGRTFSVTGGTLNLTGGTFQGDTATLITSGTTVNMDIVSARTRFNLTNSTVPGTFVIPAGDSLRLVGGSPNMTIANSGRLVLQDAMTFPGTVTTGDTTSVIEVRSSAVYGQGNVTFTNGFINTGLIELRTLNAFYGNRFAVTNGTLQNAPGAIIRAIPGFGGKELAAQLDNQGLLDVREAISLTRASSAHLNTGVIDLATANLSVSQTGTTPSFTNTGTILAPSGRTLSVTGGTLNLTGGTLQGDTATLVATNATVNMDIASARTRFNFTNTSVPGTFVIPAGDSLRLVGGSPTMTIANAGRLVMQDAMTFPGTVQTGDTTSVIEIRSSSAYGQANVAFTNGFINTGKIELVTRDAFYGNRMGVTNGTLVNAPGAVIRAVAGFGGKELAAALDNQGLLDLREGIVLNRGSSVHTNSGVIDLALANLTVTQSGTTPSFTNTGTINAPAGRTMFVTGGTLNLTGGTFNGPSATLNTGSLTLNFDLASVETRLALNSTTVPGTLTIPAGDTLRLVGGAPTMSIVNDGTLLLQNIVSLNGTLTSNTGSVVEALSSAEYGQANVTFANAFTNNGTFRLRTADAFYGQAVTFSTGTLVNGAGGTISFEGLAGRTLTAPAFTNNGTWNVASTGTVNGPIAQNALLTVPTGSTLTLSSLLTLNEFSTTTVNGTLVKNGGCTLIGSGTISGTGTGASCP